MGRINKLICPKTEGEIKSHWKYTDKIYISCVCIAYNHESYIRDALDSILAQKTEYRFELIIHDDKSTDNTRKIILEYKKKFPNIIKLILQEENQYSKCPRIISLTVPYLDGDFVTICEGDDFWIDQYKLQKQIKELILNPNVNLIITQALSLYPDGTTEKFCDLGSTKRYISFADCILGPKKDFYPTATFFFKRNIMVSLPDWFYTIAPVGDYYIQLFASYNNGCIYLPDVTSTYRRDSIGSWSQSLNFNKLISDRKNRINCNKLISKQLQLNKLEKSALNRRLFIYKKDITLSYLRHEKYFIFILNIIINFFSSPIDYSKIMFSSLVRKIGACIQSGD
ncbi:glycosyltransferase [Morganella morganii]|uniref:glycosyltransferase n=1 Tax=Morganella morganii TaxID=582 RepID=UPI000665D4F4|nr:glycosyltransferase [Morganella morganii]